MRRAARLLVPAGVVAIVLLAGEYHVRNRGPYEVTSWTWTYVVVLVLAGYATGLPDGVTTVRAATTSAIETAAFGSMTMSAVQLLVGSLLLPRFVVFASAAIVVPWMVACAVVANGGRKQERYHDRLVLVSTEQEAAAVRSELRRQPERFAYLSDVLSPEEAASRQPTAEPLVDRAITAGASIVILDRAAVADPTIVAQAATLHEAGLRIRTLASFYEEWLGKLPVYELEQISLMFDIGELHRVRYGRLKRLIDLAVALIGCVVVVLLIPFVAMANLFGNRGPLFYRQERVGRDRGTFMIAKFRSMRPTAGPPHWTVSGDSRVTAVGRWLRRLHLDELPQAWNVLRGDLSVVGPRPEQPLYVDELTRQIPWYPVRHLVRPGVTGWAQVKYGYGSSGSDALEKLQYDLFYLRHQSLHLDLRIVARTIRHVVTTGGR